MASFGDLLAKAFPNNQVQAAAPKQVPTLNTSTSKPTTSFGQLMNQPTPVAKTTSPVLAATPTKVSPIQSAVQSGSGSSGGGQQQQPQQNSGISIPSFSFDWTQADNEALQKLTPYYEGLLSQAQGDVDLAKQRIQQDYDTGARQRAEDQTAQSAEDTRTATDETRGALTSLNNRGVLVGEQTPGAGTSKAPNSDYANSYYLNPLGERQQARSLAIQRAFSRQQEQADTTKARQYEDMGTQFQRYKTNLEEEKKNKAINEMAPLKYQQELSKYNAALSGVLNA